MPCWRHADAATFYAAAFLRHAAAVMLMPLALLPYCYGCRLLLSAIILIFSYADMIALRFFAIRFFDMLLLSLDDVTLFMRQIC